MTEYPEAVGLGDAASAVQSVVRAFGILEVLAEEGCEMPLAAIARASNLPPPTTHRLLNTLVGIGYVRKGKSRSYAPGPKLIGLGLRATPHLATLAQPFLEKLESEFHETVNLACLSGELVAYVAQVPSRHHMRMFTEVGRRVLPHSTGVGKAILAGLSEQRVLEIIRQAGMPHMTTRTHASEESLLAELRATRLRGFAVDDEEQEVGVRCIAVSVPGTSPPAAMSISGPTARVTDAMVSQAVVALTQSANLLSEKQK